jgi:hypothetical protein
MGEMGHAGLRSGDAEHQFDQAVERHEGAGLHRNGGEQQHEPAFREQHPVGQQQAEHASRGTDGGGGRLVEQDDDQHLRHGRSDDAGEVVLQVADRAEHLLDVAAEHPEAQHVEHEVGQAAVQEGVGHRLPDLERHGIAGHHRDRRPEREGHGDPGAEQLLQGEADDVESDQGLGDGRQVHIPRRLIARMILCRPSRAHLGGGRFQGGVWR